MPKLFKKSPPPAKRPLLLAAIPVPNALVRVSSYGKGLRLAAALKPNPLRRFLPFQSRDLPEKRFDLDDLGAWTWNHLDGKNSVEALIRQFAADHRVNVREAEVAVIAFLKMLTRRNLIALVAPPGCDKVASRLPDEHPE